MEETTTITAVKQEVRMRDWAEQTEAQQTNWEEWLDAQNVSGKGKLAKAVHYALNEKKYLYTFLDDGNVPIDNNRAENAICPFAVGRKNWLFNWNCQYHLTHFSQKFWLSSR